MAVPDPSPRESDPTPTTTPGPDSGPTPAPDASPTQDPGPSVSDPPGAGTGAGRRTGEEAPPDDFGLAVGGVAAGLGAGVVVFVLTRLLFSRDEVRHLSFGGIPASDGLQLAIAVSAGLALGLLGAAVEAVARRGRRGLAVAAGLLAAPLIAAVAAHVIEMSWRGDAYLALASLVDDLARPWTWLTSVPTCALGALACWGPLLLHRVAGAPPGRQSAGMALGAAFVLVLILLPALHIWRDLVVALTVALLGPAAVAPWAYRAGERLARTLRAALRGDEVERPSPRGLLAALRDLRRDPWPAAEERARPALAGQAAIVDVAWRVLAVAAALDVAMGLLARLATWSGARRQVAAWLDVPWPGREWLLPLVRLALLLLLAALLAVRVARRPPAAAAWGRLAVAAGLLLAVHVEDGPGALQLVRAALVLGLLFLAATHLLPARVTLGLGGAYAVLGLAEAWTSHRWGMASWMPFAARLDERQIVTVAALLLLVLAAAAAVAGRLWRVAVAAASTALVGGVALHDLMAWSFATCTYLQPGDAMAAAAAASIAAAAALGRLARRGQAFVLAALALLAVLALLRDPPTIEPNLTAGHRALEGRAAAGDAAAMLELAERLEVGLDCWPERPADALAWYRRAAEAGHAGAMHRLASRLERGRSVRRDPGEAAAWFAKARAAGWPDRREPGEVELRPEQLPVPD